MSNFSVKMRQEVEKRTEDGSMKQARFWIMASQGNLVRLKINENEGLTHSSAWNTDEGWSSEAHAWSFDGKVVSVSSSTDGCDCDGRLQRFSEGKCGLRNLDANVVEGVGFPLWDWTSGSQRDYSAEAMGY